MTKSGIIRAFGDKLHLILLTFESTQTLTLNHLHLLVKKLIQKRLALNCVQLAWFEPAVCSLPTICFVR